MTESLEIRLKESQLGTNPLAAVTLPHSGLPKIKQRQERVWSIRKPNIEQSGSGTVDDCLSLFAILYYTSLYPSQFNIINISINV